MSRPRARHVQALLVLAVACLCANAAAGSGSSFPRPPWQQRARMARWLVHESTWGTLSVVDDQGLPVSNVVSVGDGPRGQPTGRLIFYMSPLDELPRALAARPDAAFTLSEAQRLPGGCGDTDPEDPTCAKVTVLGRGAPVPAEAREEVRALLFSRHPQMADWPADHGFQLWELAPSEVRLLDYYGGMAVIQPDEYFGALGPAAAAAEGAAGAGSRVRAAGGGALPQGVAAAGGGGVGPTL